MNEELAARYAEELRATLGYEGRMISFSKGGYSTAHPEHVAVFNANLCVAAGKLWWGDLDLTVDEPLLKPPRHAPRPLLSLRPTLKLRRLTIWIAITAWPGLTRELRTGCAMSARR